MADLVLVVAWTGAIGWPALAAFLLWRMWRKGRRPGWMAGTAIAFISVFWGLGIRAVLWEPATLHVRHVDVTSRAWSGAPLRIGVISDTHTDGPHMGVPRLKSIIEQMNAERPDLVVLLGDFVGGHTPMAQRSPEEQREIAEGLAAFAGLQVSLGVWAVLGNHDWWYDGPAVEQALLSAGVGVLENAGVRIPREAGPFWIGGLADYESRRAQPSYETAMGGLTAGEPVIVMSHWPDAFTMAPDTVALTLAGHSHCGQVNLPLLGRPVAVSPGAKRWPCGLYEEDGRQLYVSGGVGVSVLPVRLGQPPEIAVITLREF